MSKQALFNGILMELMEYLDEERPNISLLERPHRVQELMAKSTKANI